MSFSNRNHQGNDNLMHLRVPPQSLEAEKAILASILSDNDAINLCLETLTPEDFYKEAHQMIFRGMMDLNAKNEPVDLVTLNHYLENKKNLEQIGGSIYLSQLVEATPVAANIESYRRLIQVKSLLRKLIHAAS